MLALNSPRTRCKFPVLFPVKREFRNPAAARVLLSEATKLLDESFNIKIVNPAGDRGCRAIPSGDLMSRLPKFSKYGRTRMI